MNSEKEQEIVTICSSVASWILQFIASYVSSVVDYSWRSFLETPEKSKKRQR